MLSLPDGTEKSTCPSSLLILANRFAECNVEQYESATSPYCQWQYGDDGNHCKDVKSREAMNRPRGHLSNLSHDNCHISEVFHTYTSPTMTAYNFQYSLTGRNAHQWGNSTVPRAALLASPGHALTGTASGPFLLGGIIIAVNVTVPTCLLVLVYGNRKAGYSCTWHVH